MKYQIGIRLVFEDVVEVEADDLDEAIEIAESEFDAENAVCNWMHYMETYQF